MNGVAVAPFGLKIHNCSLTRQGEFIATAPESPQKLCTETGILDSWVPKCWEKLEVLSKHIFETNGKYVLQDQDAPK